MEGRKDEMQEGVPSIFVINLPKHLSGESDKETVRRVLRGVGEEYQKCVEAIENPEGIEGENLMTVMVDEGIEKSDLMEGLKGKFYGEEFRVNRFEPERREGLAVETVAKS